MLARWDALSGAFGVTKLSGSSENEKSVEEQFSFGGGKICLEDMSSLGLAIISSSAIDCINRRFRRFCLPAAVGSPNLRLVCSGISCCGSSRKETEEMEEETEAGE